jgi:hypothetical protein
LIAALSAAGIFRRRQIAAIETLAASAANQRFVRVGLDPGNFQRALTTGAYHLDTRAYVFGIVFGHGLSSSFMLSTIA